ncbi:MAG: PaaI family thioesterase [Anaerovoracaceae bacterium]|jgi:uncharacterized protein (TIGR00369 family)
MTQQRDENTRPGGQNPAGERQRPDGQNLSGGQRRSDGQARMEAHLARTMEENNEQQRARLNGMMRSRSGGCSYADRTLTLHFPLDEWQANRAGSLHGGMLCTAFDMTMAALARFYAGEKFAPTVSLDVKYIRPVAVDDELVVTAKATAAGRRITQLTAEARSGRTGKLAATAASVYLNVDTSRGGVDRIIK